MVCLLLNHANRLCELACLSVITNLATAALCKLHQADIDSITAQFSLAC